MSTDSTTAARDHARSQVRAATMRIPATPPDVEPSRLLWAESVPAGSYATRVLGRGTRLRLIDPDGGACAHLLLFRSDAPWERLNVADTVKVPWQAYLTAGHPLLSDQGRVLATVVADSSGHHDTLCGMTDAGRAKMLLAAIKHGLDIRDVAPSVSLFKGVRVGDDGTLGFTGSAGPGAAVDLLIHLPVTVALVNTAHPLTPTLRSPASTCWPGAQANSSLRLSTRIPNTCARCSTPKARGPQRKPVRHPNDHHRTDHRLRRGGRCVRAVVGDRAGRPDVADHRPARQSGRRHAAVRRLG